jgi:hypothetical protein
LPEMAINLFQTENVTYKNVPDRKATGRCHAPTGRHKLIRQQRIYVGSATPPVAFPDYREIASGHSLVH